MRYGLLKMSRMWFWRVLERWWKRYWGMRVDGGTMWNMPWGASLDHGNLVCETPLKPSWWVMLVTQEVKWRSQITDAMHIVQDASWLSVSHTQNLYTKCANIKLTCINRAVTFRSFQKTVTLLCIPPKPIGFRLTLIQLCIHYFLMKHIYFTWIKPPKCLLLGHLMFYWRGTCMHVFIHYLWKYDPTLVILCTFAEGHVTQCQFFLMF